jgi:two-component system, OmpR family, phosphate regulon sensor histidine kinase PhoR
MNRFRWLALLMGIAILGITGFQLYWLLQNYQRERSTLILKASFIFRTTIEDLQAKDLKLWVPRDSIGLHNSARVIVAGDGKNIKVTRAIEENVISQINVIRDKMRDTVIMMDTIRMHPSGGVGKRYVSMDKTTTGLKPDSPNYLVKLQMSPDRDQIFQFLYGVDSLQDSLRVTEIDSAYRNALREQHINVPYKIARIDSLRGEERGDFDIMVGFAKPITYRLKLGNTMGYLMKRISMPILFSIMLLGITILSFMLLYRNLIRQQRLAALKNEFISNITHELKTPIATVGVAIEALKNFNAMQDPQRTKEYLDISSNELHRLSLLVDKVLKLSMFEKKGIELKHESLNLEELVNEVLTSLKLQLEKKHAQVTLRTEGLLEIMGDRLHLLSVIFNLFDNSIKYSKEAPIIDVQLKEEAGAIILKISDKGIGIPPEYRDKVFEKFFRIPHGDTHNAKGYGLGLSYAAQVVRKHGGTIQCENHPGDGTTFTITLPKKPS